MAHFFCSMAGFLLLFPIIATAQGLEDWEKDYQVLGAGIKVTARDGVSVFSGPGPNYTETNTIGKAIAFRAHGFVEVNGVRFYVQESDYNKWLDEQKRLVWIRVNGKEELPPLPPRIFEGMGIDPNSGENIRIEVYEEEVLVQAETDWPMQAPENPDRILPVKVISSKENEDGSWEAAFTVYPNFDSNVWKLGFPEPSFNQFSDPEYQVNRKLISRPDRKETVVRGSDRAEPIVPVLKPGVVFHGSFSGGNLVGLRVGDNWPPVVACSNLSPALFQGSEELRFRFHATTLDGGHTMIEVVPDSVTGTDYTNYQLISDLGAPFSDEMGMPEWGMEEWAIELRSDQSVSVEAPLWDGRGAAGMLELEGLGLEPSYEEEIKLLKSMIDSRPPKLTEAAGWKSILKEKLGEIPESQRIEGATGEVR